jgi:GntR family transcriptional regulator
VILQVDLTTPTPPYEQIRVHLAGQIKTGRLASGVQLPSVRQLAADLGLASGTVAHAYRELESAGLIVTRGRRGTFVANTIGGDAQRLARARLVRAAADFAQTVRALDVDGDTVLAAVRDALATSSSLPGGDPTTSPGDSADISRGSSPRPGR